MILPPITIVLELNTAAPVNVVVPGVAITKSPVKVMVAPPPVGPNEAVSVVELLKTILWNVGAGTTVLDAVAPE